LVLEEGRISGILISDNSTLRARAVVLTSGTFLSAVMHTGENQEEGGRSGDKSSKSLSNSLKSLGFTLNRLKTGTPPRLSKKSIDFSKTEIQPGDKNPRPFSRYFGRHPFPTLPQVPCHITHTNQQTHEIIKENLHRSPMFSGAITGKGPRYCPSIEDKVDRFADKDRHQIFLEPEGLDVDEIYVNGVSTSLPADVQESFIRSVPGLSNSRFIRYGYAVEYDAVDARVLKPTLESKDVPGLFLAGQLNGTSGYEEAAAQGLIAGINAALGFLGKDEFILKRHQGYIGVLIDDLVTKGTDEPYRMFTSRAEYRLLLREDNSDERLSELGFQLGVLSNSDHRVFLARQVEKRLLTTELTSTYFTAATPGIESLFEANNFPALRDRIGLKDLLKRPGVTLENLRRYGIFATDTSKLIQEHVECEVKYEGYIAREKTRIDRSLKEESVPIPNDLEFEKVSGLSIEIRGRLKITRPTTLGQMSRIPGVTPAAVANLLIHMKTLSKSEKHQKRV